MLLGLLRCGGLVALLVSGCYAVVSGFWISWGGLSGFAVYGLYGMDFWFRGSLLAACLLWFNALCFRCSLLGTYGGEFADF